MDMGTAMGVGMSMEHGAWGMGTGTGMGMGTAMGAGTGMGTGGDKVTLEGHGQGAVGLMGNAAKGQRGYWGTRPGGNGPNGDGLARGVTR